MPEDETLTKNIETALHKILADRDIPEDSKIDFKIEEIKKGSHVRTNTYFITVTAPTELKLFCKEYIDEVVVKDLAGRRQKTIVEEELFSKLLQKVKGFVPFYYMNQLFSITERQTTYIHLLKFNEKYDNTLGDKLSELFSKKTEILKNPNLPQTEKTANVEKIEDEAGDWLRRFSDIIMVNNFLFNSKYRIDETKKIVRQFDRLKFSYDMITYFNIFLQRIIPQMEEREEWKINHRYDKILGIIIDEVTDYIGKHSGNQVSLFGPHPAHCLYQDGIDLSNPTYCPESILKIRDGQPKEKTPYTGFAICDLTKLGTYTPLLGLASLFTDPSVTRLMPKEKIKPKIEMGRGGLLDHSMVSERRIKENKSNIYLEDILGQEQRQFLELFSRASIWALLRKIYFVSSLEPERLKELTGNYSAYNPPEEFVRLCIDGICSIYDPAENFKYLKEGFRDLEKELNKEPYTLSMKN